jgi:cell division protein FtsL
MYRILLLVLIAFAFLLQGLLIYVINELAAGNPDVDKSRKELQALKAENWLLQSEILEKTSLTYISHRAKEMGFIQATYVVIPIDKSSRL